MKRTFVVLIAVFVMCSILYGQKAPQGEEFKKWMQDIDAQMKNFIAAYDGMDMAKASSSIAALQKGFENVETHYAKAQKADAINWTKGVRTRLDEASDRMKRQDIAYALNMVQLAQKTCKSCHDVYRPAPAKTNND